MSPRTIATTSSSRAPPSRPAVRKTAFAVRDPGTPRNAASSRMVRAPGVATRSTGSGASAAAGSLRKRAIWRLAAYPQPSQSTRVSSPTGVRYMNSCARLPPIIPTSEPTAMVGSAQRPKMRKYAS